MNFFTCVFFSLSIGIGAALGRVRFRRIDPAFFPFVFYLWIGFFNECLSLVLLYNGYSNVVNYNVFSLLEVLLIGFQFYRWNLLTQRQWTAFWLVALVWWTAESRLCFTRFDSYFVIGYSFLIVLISIGAVNRLLFRDPSPLIKNPEFLICVAFILYFSLSALTETFWIFGVQQSASFRLHIHHLFNYVNLFTNLLYAFSVLWMPMRRDFILPC